MDYKFSSLLDYVQPSPVAELLSLGADKSLISFGGGFPDSSLFPIEAISEAFVHAIHSQPDLSLQYSVIEGIPSLRQKVADRARATAGFDCRMEQVMLTQGGTQALDLVSSLLLERGDTVICENPTYMGAMGPFDLRGCRYVGVEMDDEGMDVDRLEAALKAHPEAKLIYTIPDFQNPTGVTLSTERRRRVVELANR
ncbi:MAG: PLP-dependent aminotransferase family protein [Clostridiales bacterium]|nr:PLP-dependent aminotransferase family protein [Clostridiales bacterium]